MFRDRKEAGQRLGAELARFAREEPIVLGLPRGGVPVAFEVARMLDAPLGLAMVRKIGAPHQPELALGAVADGPRPVVVLNADVVAALGISRAFLEAEEKRQLAEIARRRSLYAPHLAKMDIAGKTAILVDDGIATGATVRAAVRAARAAGAARVVVATPVASPEAEAMLQTEADEVVCLETPQWLGAIGGYYADFRQVGDDEVTALLDEAAKARAGGPSRRDA